MRVFFYSVDEDDIPKERERVYATIEYIKRERNLRMFFSRSFLWLGCFGYICVVCGAVCVCVTF